MRDRSSADFLFVLLPDPPPQEGVRILSQISHFLVSHNELITIREFVVFAAYERHVLAHGETGDVDTGIRREA